MNDSDIGYASARTLARLYRAKEISPVEVVQAIYRHIEASEPHLNAMARAIHEHALPAFRLLPEHSRILRRLGLPADPGRQRSRIRSRPSRSAELDGRRRRAGRMDALLLSLQLVRQSRREHPLRVHLGGPARGLADRRAPLRRPWGAASQRRLRGGTPLGAASSGALDLGAIGIGPRSPVLGATALSEAEARTSGRRRATAG